MMCPLPVIYNVFQSRHSLCVYTCTIYIYICIIPTVPPLHTNKMTKLLIDFRRTEKKEKEKGKNPVIIHYICVCSEKMQLKKKKKKKNASPRLKYPGLMNRPRKSEKKKVRII